MIFENAHEFSEGLEFELFQKLIKYASESHDIGLAIGISYRPKENLPEHLLGKDVKESRCEKIILAPLKQNEAGLLINNLIPFPVLCEELQEFIFDRSKGNPFYIKELLRHLISSENSYVQRIGHNWYPSPNFHKDTYASQVSTLLLQRAREDTGEYFPVLQVLSVVGLDLPYRLLAPLFHENHFFTLQENELLGVLEELERTGILKKTNSESVAELEYQFEHQLMRDAIYDDVRASVKHAFIREQLVATIIANEYNRHYHD